MKEIIVKSQKELEAIGADFKGVIRIKDCVEIIYIRAAYDNASVRVRDNASVVAYGNVQIVKHSESTTITISANARIVYIPKTVSEFLDFYGIKHTDTTAIFYKAVRKINGVYCSDYDRNFTYKIKRVKKEKCDKNPDKNCSTGIHVAYLNWALDYGRAWDNLAILEVEVNIEDIILPTNSTGKVRTNRVKVLREVPLEECGILGNIIARRRTNEQQ